MFIVMKLQRRMPLPGVRQATLMFIAAQTGEVHVTC